MKKILISFVLMGLMLLAGCVNEKDDADSEGEVLSNEKSKVVNLNLTAEEQKTVETNFNESDNYVDAILSNENVIVGNSESMKKLIEAVKLFKTVETDMSILKMPVLSIDDIKDVKGAVKKLTRKMTKEILEESFENSNVEYQDMMKEDILPRLDKALILLDEAVKENETVIIMTAKESGVNLKIEPSHILLVESLVRVTRGYINYMLGYDFKNIDEKTGEYNQNFMTVTDREYIEQSQKDIKKGVQELIESINALPESNAFKFDKRTYLLEYNSNADYSKIENIISIPAELKLEAVTVLTQLKNAIDGAATITVSGYSIKLNLSVLFDTNFELADILDDFSEIIPYEDETIDNWDDTALANYTFEGIVPNGLMDLMESFGEGNWENFVEEMFNEEDNSSEIVEDGESLEIYLFDEFIEKSKKIRKK